MLQKLRSVIKKWIVIFIICLVLSGLTALGIETQMTLLSGLFPPDNTIAGEWLNKVHDAIKFINQKYPFVSYGFDWLAFAHLAIAVAFIGPLKEPVRNKWVIQFGRIICILVIPFALLAGSFRGLPFWWICIDCSFGILGFIPLTICYNLVNKLEMSSSNLTTIQTN